jgi:sensor histidine kinase YesM
MRNPWIRTAVIVAGWACLGLVLSMELFLRGAGAKMGWPQPEFGEVAIGQFGRALMWAGVAPFILQMRRKLPLRRGRWVGGVGFHVMMSFVVMATFYLGRMFAYTLLWNEHEGEFWWVSIHSFNVRNLVDMVFYWAVIAVGYSLEIHQRYKNEELRAAQLEARLVEIELKALREQLRPHFLFNTLNTIAVLVREQKNDEAVNLIARLSALLRMTLDSTRVHEVTLRQEMDFLERYLEIQKARFSDRLNVEIAIEPPAMDARIPNLLLQPIVENAIVHGIATKSGPGHVAVLGRVEGGRLHLEVRDDGPGLGDGTKRAKEGVGLTNTRERLAKIYGAHGQLLLRSEPGRGVSVQITLPCRT